MRSAKRWAAFISGTGSNLGALLDSRGSSDSGADIALVVSSSTSAFGLLKARRAGVPVLVLAKPIDWESLLLDLKKYRIDAIFMVGFMKIVPANFLSRFWGVVVNLHPSLLPSYPGIKSIEKAFSERAPMGVTVHHVVAEVDSGAVVLQRRVNAEPDLISTDLMVHISEQRLVRQGLRVVAGGEILA